MMPYDSRSTTSSAPVQRSLVAPQYVMQPYTVATMPSMPAPHYPSHNGFGYSGYNNPPGPLGSPFKQTYPERPSLRVMAPENDHGRYPRDGRGPYDEHSQSPSVKSDAQASTPKSAAPNPSVTAKTITSNISINPKNEVSFSTNVDTLMKAIQSKSETESIIKKVEADYQATQTQPPPSTPEVVVQRPVQSAPTAVPPPQQSEGGGKSSRKRYICDIPGCNKSFCQKTHLDIHRRAHTGDRPYVSHLTSHRSPWRPPVMPLYP
jgi:hypothetical protein